MTYLIFAIVAALLMGMAYLFGITYNTANILVYYLLIPLSWAMMIDKIVKKKMPYFSMTYCTIWVLICILTAGHFQTWCDNIFQKSTDFLMWFEHWGWNYYRTSVYICVWLPLIVYGILTWLLLRKHLNRRWKQWGIGIISVFVVCWLIQTVVLTFGTRLVATHQRTGHEYTLSSQQKSRILKDTQGMTVDKIVSYAEKCTCRALTFSLAPYHKVNEGNCVDYAAMCTAIANYAFHANRIDAKATHSVGTVKMLGIDLCKSITNLEWVKRNSMVYSSFINHDFVTICHANKVYHVDPSVKDLLGFDLKTTKSGIYTLQIILFINVLLFKNICLSFMAKTIRHVWAETFLFEYGDACQIIVIVQKMV